MRPAPSDFYRLNPDLLLEMCERLGLYPTGRYVQLNSYENRVFDLEFESTDLQLEAPGFDIKNNEGDFFQSIIKVYRPGRWTKQSIQEEHDFLYALREQGMTAVAPFKVEGQSLFEHQGLYFCLFPKARGRMVQEFSLKDYEAVGRQIARLHNVGTHFQSSHRPIMDMFTYGDQSLEWTENYIYPELKNKYFDLADEILAYLEDRLDESSYICIHGDCHKGNILQSDPKEGESEYFFVDLDDFCQGPVVQDFWMLLEDTDLKDNPGLKALLQGYESLRHFNLEDLKLIPGLQGLRIIYYAGWIAKRWSDPSFQKIFPNYLTYNYWLEEIRSLEQCLERF